MTTNVNNRGIMHLVSRASGQVACRNRRAHMGVSKEAFRNCDNPCKKCQAVLAKWDAIAAKILARG